MTSPSTLLQIVPRPPGTQDGVADYAVTVARILRDRYSIHSVFMTKQYGPARATSEFEVQPLFDNEGIRKVPRETFQHVLLHYVNYGYHKRGVPLELLARVKALRGSGAGRFVTVFHELYASGPPWKSAFWLRPFQIRLVRSMARISDACVVSSESMLNQLKKIAPAANILVRPVPSNFGEPSLSTNQLANRSPHCWAICGGTILVERSLRSFRVKLDRVPAAFFPNKLFILGGEENPRIRWLLSELSNISAEYHPGISPSEASAILSSCSFSWLDYFHNATVPTDVVLKSGAFAAACAHGVIPIFPQSVSSISVEGDQTPGPFSVDSYHCALPAVQDRTKCAADIYKWYQRHASSDNLARGIASALGLAPAT